MGSGYRRVGVAGSDSTKEVKRGRRVVRVTSADRVLFPGDGVTKGDLVDYYLVVAPALLPHLAGRPLVQRRMPEGIDGPHFFEKDLPAFAPD